MRHHHFRPHRPIHCRMTLDQSFQQIGLAIDAPKPPLNLESPLLRGPDVPKPAPVVRPRLDLAVLVAQINAVVAPLRTMLASVVAITAPLLRFPNRRSARVALN